MANSAARSFAPKTKAPFADSEKSAARDSLRKFASSFVMGGVSAAVAKTLAAPLEVVKLRMQGQEEMIKTGALDRRYSGAVDCLRRVVREDEMGFRALWKGNFVNIIRYFPTQALNFAFKDQFKNYFACRREESGYARFLLGNVLSGSLAGSISLAFVYSLDTCRTKLANDKRGVGGIPKAYRGIIDVYRKTYAVDGLRGLYAGFVLSCFGIAVYRGLYFGIFDTVKELSPREMQSRFAYNFMVGWAVTTSAGLLAYPFDTVRRRMMMAAGRSGQQYRGSIHCLLSIIEKEGPKALFRGAGVNVLRGVAGAGVLATYSKLEELLAIRLNSKE